MTKRFILSLLLLSSLGTLHAEPELQPQQKSGILQEVAQTMNGMSDKEAYAFMLKTVQEDPGRIAQELDAVTLSFQIRRDVEYSQAEWNDFIKQIITFVIACRGREQSPELNEELMASLGTLIKQAYKICGDKTRIHGEFGVSVSDGAHQACVAYDK